MYCFPYTQLTQLYVSIFTSLKHRSAFDCANIVIVLNQYCNSTVLMFPLYYLTQVCLYLHIIEAS